MKKLLLINPVGRRSGFLLSKFSTFPPLSLAYVAAVTPPDWEVKIIDENFDNCDFEEADLVGITAFTSNINRAYEIARRYREKNIKVVMGGIHVSMLPDEALQYADSVVIGEAEGVWEKVITDFIKNSLEPKYYGPQLDLTSCNVMPRRDLLHPGYLWHSVQTSRGCPFDCHFCSVSKHMGKEYRQRRAEDVLEELQSIQSSYITFVDDNLIGYTEKSRLRAKTIFKGMIERNLRKKWWMQTSINAADDEHVVELAAKSGCMFVFIGFETLKEQFLLDMKKGINLKTGVNNYEKVINTFHKHGIAVLGAFIIGNDHEYPKYYKELAEYLVHSGIDIVQICILTPLPGTQLMEHLQQVNRIVHGDFPHDWDKYRFSYMVHQPEGVDENTVYWGNNYIKQKIYSFPTYQYRLLRSAFNLKNLTNMFTTYKMNKAFKRGWLHSHYSSKY
jgi:radical SAM superfamily enzyme YgiQ (UPF0313 family)